jgi:small redox-active disulfide protein 2
LPRRDPATPSVRYEGDEMKRLQVFGAGCQKCLRLAEVAREAAEALGIQYELESVTDIREIVASGVVIIPAFAVNSEVKACGTVPSVDEMKALLA